MGLLSLLGSLIKKKKNNENKQTSAPVANNNKNNKTIAPINNAANNTAKKILGVSAANANRTIAPIGTPFSNKLSLFQENQQNKYQTISQPVKTQSEEQKKKTNSEPLVEKKKNKEYKMKDANKKWTQQVFQKGALKDGFNAKNFAKSVLATGTDITQDVAQGILQVPESIGDITLNAVATASDMAVKNWSEIFGSNDTALLGGTIAVNKDTGKKLRDFANVNLAENISTGVQNPFSMAYNVVNGTPENIVNPMNIKWDKNKSVIDNYGNNLKKTLTEGSSDKNLSYEKDSLMGYYADEAVKLIGYTAGIAGGTQMLGKSGDIPVKLGKHTLKMPTLALTGGMSSGLQEANSKENVSESERWGKAVSSGLIEAFTEGMFGMFGVGGSDLDDALVKAASSKFKSSVGKTLASLGIKSFGESTEELLSYALNFFVDNNIIDKLGNSDFSQEWDWKEVGEQMALAFASTVLSQGGSEVITTNNAIKYAEKEAGRKLTNKEKALVTQAAIDRTMRSNIENKETKINQDNSVSLSEQLEKQGTRIMEDSLSETEAMIDNFKTYLEENNIKNPTQKDIDDSIVDMVGYDNELDDIETANKEQKYNQVIHEYLKEQNNNTNKTESNNDSFSLKQKQLDIIKESNPMQDDYHTGIRDIEDIKTSEEAFKTKVDLDEDYTYPDFTQEDGEKALKSGKITVYSSYPIEQGAFVTPSKMMAQDYAGNNNVYSKEIDVNDVAWINTDEGQYAKVENKIEQQNNDSNIDRDFLEGYPNSTIRHWESSNNDVVVKNYKQLDSLIDEAINTNENINRRLHLGRINESIVSKVRKMISNFPKKKGNYFSSDVYDIVLNQSEIRHLRENKTRVTNEDIHDYVKKIPDIISEPDNVIYSDDGNSEGLRFEKKYDDGKYYSFTLVNDKKKTLQVKTSFMDTSDFEAKKRSMSLPKDAQRAPSRTSETSKAFASYGNNIPQNEQKVNSDISTNSNMQNNEKNVQKETTKEVKKAIAPLHEEVKALRKEISELKENIPISYEEFEQYNKKIAPLLEEQEAPPEIEQIQDNLKDTTKLSEKELKMLSKNIQKTLGLTNKQKLDLENMIQDYSTSETATKQDLFNTIKEKFSTQNLQTEIEEIKNVQNAIRSKKIKVSQNIRNDITDYYKLKQSNFGKIKFSNEGLPVDTVYQELNEEYPNYFPSDILNESDQFKKIVEVANLENKAIEELNIDDDYLKEISEYIHDSIREAKEDSIKRELEKDIKSFYKDKKATPSNQNAEKLTRKEVRRQLIKEMGIDEFELSKGDDISSINYQLTDPIRVNEKVFGRELGKKINEATIERTKHNTAEKTRWLNKERAEIKELGIKPRSKESAAVQKYGEKQYLNEKGELLPYGDKQLADEFSDINTQEKIKKAAEALRNKYDQYIDQINNNLVALGYDPIPKRADYMKHFAELGDVFSQTGVPFNLNDMKAEDLPTDINGLTEFNKPGKNWFASSQKRYGMKTNYDAITGIDGYLEGASNLIYHTEDIQRYRALSTLIRDTFGQTKGFENLDGLSNEEIQQRISDIQSNKLSKYVAWLDEQANSLAGKKGAIDRGVERAIGRRAYTALNTIKKQVGSNMTGFNVRSAMTNFISSTIAASKTNKVAMMEGTVSTIKNMFHNDGYINKSDFLTSRFGSDMLSKKMWQKASNAGQIFMTGSDYLTANIINRSKYYEGLHKGMTEEQAIKYADDFSSRVMGDRSQGATAEVFNSKTLGLLTQFQLEVNNQWQYMIHDSKMDYQSIKANTNGINAGATILFQMGQLAGFSYFFNELFEKITGSRAAFDPIEIIKKLFGIGDDDEDKTQGERIEEAIEVLLDNVPFGNLFTGGGRIPVSEAIPIKQLLDGKDKNGYDKSRIETIKETVPYYFLPTGYSQIKKTKQGLSMFSKDKEIKGSYTDSGKLRFPIKDTTSNRIKSGLFGQWSSNEAKEYINSGMAPLNEAQTLAYKKLSKYDVSINDYRNYKKEISKIAKENDDYTESKKKIINTIKNMDIPDEAKYILYNTSYNKNNTFNIAEKIGIGADEFLDYASQTFKADKDKNGNSISGSKKTKVINYINSMDIDDEQKLILYKLEYNSDNEHNNEIIDYLNNSSVTYEEEKYILEKLGFKVKKDGTITWE